MAQAPNVRPAASANADPATSEARPGTMADTMPDTMIVQSVLFADMAGTFGAELLRFASRRMAAQAELLAGLSQCRSVQDLLDRQMDFMRCAGADYAEGFSTMAKLAQSTQPAATDPARGNAD